MELKQYEELFEQKIFKEDGRYVCYESVVIMNESLLQFPDNLTIKGDLSIYHSDIINFSEGMVIEGDLTLDRCGRSFGNFPSDILIGGSLYVEKTDMVYLPKHLNHFKTLSITHSNLDYLPENLHIEESLYLYGTSITKLPKGFKCGESIYIRNQRLDSLPKDLSLKGSLYVKDTSIAQLPKGLKVGYSLHAENTLLKTLPEDIQVGHHIALSYSPIEKLPNGLVVNGNLDCDHSNLKELPSDLVVGGSLDISHSRVSIIPATIKVSGGFSACHTKIKEIPDTLCNVTFLYADDSPLEKLPEAIACPHISIEKTKVKELPENLVVDWLDISHTEIQSLPKGCVVGLSLHISKDMDVDAFKKCQVGWEILVDLTRIFMPTNYQGANIFDTKLGKVMSIPYYAGRLIGEENGIYHLQDLYKDRDIYAFKNSAGVWDFKASKEKAERSVWRQDTNELTEINDD